MRRVLYLITLLLFVAEGASAATFLTVNRQFTWFYKPASDVSLDTTAKNFQNYVLSYGDESKRDYLKSKGVTTPFFAYMVLNEVQDPGSCTAQPSHNQAGYNPGDFCWLKTYHSDWFLKDKYGNRIQNGSGYYYMDPGNTSFQSWWLSRARVYTDSRGWNGIYLDNVDASLARFQQLGKLPTKYTSDSSYSTAVQGFLSYLWWNYFSPKGYVLMANITCVRSDTVYANFLNYLTGALTEAWAVDWHTGYRTVSQWDADLKRVEAAESKGKHSFIVSQGDKSDYQRQQFAYASYLLVAKGYTSFRYSNQSYYKSTWLYTNYTIDIGTPTGNRYQNNGIWYRYFTRGYVSVDPNAHTGKIVKTS